MILQSLKAASLYFILVCGAGFMLGTLRVLWLVQRVGERAAELMEMPVMLVVTALAARWTVRRLNVPPAPTQRLAIGASAFGFLLLAEFALVLGLRGLTFAEYVARRDPVSGTAFVIMLLLYALMPAIVMRQQPPTFSTKAEAQSGRRVLKTAGRS